MLKGKVAIVTGGSRDIGRQVAIKLAAEGAKVCVNYLNSETQANETVSLIKQNGGEAFACYADVTREQDVKEMVAACLHKYGSVIHILVNTAGGLIERRLLADADEDFLTKVLAINFNSVFLATKHVVPFMQQGSSIINFSSQAARDGGGFGASIYASAKAAVQTFTRGMAKELGPKGIRVNCVSPGMINTTFHDTFTKPEVRASVAASAPLRREGNAQEVADAVCYLAGESSSYVTGASIEINGGTYFS
jgi:3-oxoacyl-[acyl-carrier protein] reductase